MLPGRLITAIDHDSKSAYKVHNTAGEDESIEPILRYYNSKGLSVTPVYSAYLVSNH
jgi:hypothetical protein